MNLKFKIHFKTLEFHMFGYNEINFGGTNEINFGGKKCLRENPSFTIYPYLKILPHAVKEY